MTLNLSARSLVVYALIILLAVGLLYGQREGNQARIREVQRISLENCESVNKVKLTLSTYINQQISRSARSLPTIDYYRRHPVELGRALANIERQRQATNKAFAPTPC